ncbi:hypothetical protein Psal027_02647 [Piscirickettsia salmonis]|nr:hypothetical protein Psal001_02630 [Piscirickettsia salmonis]QGN81973.1 hypothetical protein Psal002_02648 [Piscirickettsia salmonis]QGN83755.1 hypothetical protein Psal003_00784 [Piscirickettsia salmonis]QGN87267.1 hypothetical protein Psal004_00782 [Piscirickettsia salmonis]QGN92609.1 hypothetical protein Psal005_02677 [Piscirickettsia salmonis]
MNMNSLLRVTLQMTEGETMISSDQIATEPMFGGSEVCIIQLNVWRLRSLHYTIKSLEAPKLHLSESH